MKKNYRACQKGAAAVEFALVVIILMLIVAGIIEFGRAFWYYDALTKATRDGARYMSTVNWIKIAGSSGIPATQTLVVNAANAANISPPLTTANVYVTCLDAAFATIPCVIDSTAEYVKVSIGAPATPYNVTIGEWIGFALPGGGVATFTPHTTMRYMCGSSAAPGCY
jgi:Flp pilus assembly protein TadG